MINERSPTFAEVAKEIAGEGPVPHWLETALERYARLLVAREDDILLETKMLKAARYLHEILPNYAEMKELMEKRWGFPAPDWMDELSCRLYEAIETLEQEATPRHAKWDASATICAAVVCRAYQLAHGHPSYAVRHLCELYWRACGNEQTGKEGDPGNWRRDLKRVKDDPDQWPLDDLEELRSSSCTQSAQK
jgi:hypothetical protein